MAPTQYTIIRRRVGYLTTDTTSLPNAEIDDLITEASELYDDTASQYSYATVTYLEGLLADSAKLASYKQNQTSENVSDIFGHIEKLLTYWNSKLQQEIAAAESSDYGSARFGKTVQIPSRRKEYPNS